MRHYETPGDIMGHHETSRDSMTHYETLWMQWDYMRQDEKLRI